MAEKDSLGRKLLYIFLLGLTTYAWWRINAEIKRRIIE